MKPIKVWNDDTKEFVAGGNQRHGDNLYIERPYEEPFEKVWYNYEDIPEDEWRKEFELIVTNKVWSEEIRWGAALEHSDTYYYAHKDVLNRGFTAEELNFINAYKDRFVLIRIDKTNYAYDNETKKMYEIKNDDYFYVSFKDFKAELKNLNLI